VKSIEYFGKAIAPIEEDTIRRHSYLSKANICGNMCVIYFLELPKV
jgi:hypothetical protein